MTNTIEVKSAYFNRDEDGIYTLFRLLDHDNDGFIELKELQTAIMSSAKTLNLTHDEAEELLSTLKKIKNEQIDFGDLSAMVAKAKRLQMRRLILFGARMMMPKGEKPEIYRYLLENWWIPPPLFMIFVSILQIALYFYYAILSKEPLSPIGPTPFDSIFILSPVHLDQLWRYISYQFVHSGYYHLICNVFVQLLLGLPLELVYKSWRVGLLYTMGMATGALAMRALDSTSYLCGASASAYTLLAVHLVNGYVKFRTMKLNWTRLILTALVALISIRFSLYKGDIDREQGIRVSRPAHVGGFVTGLWLGIVLLRNLRSVRWELAIWWSSLVLYLIFVGICIMLIIYGK